jgi:lysophospholipase L1-like esterase
MRPSRKAFLLNATLALISILVTCILAEIALRVFPPPSLDRKKILTEVGRMVPPYLMLPDPELGWVLASGFKGEGHGPGWNVTLTTNSMGMRDHEYDPLDGSPHVVLVGDSYAFGYGVEAEEAFPKVAEREAAQGDLAGLEVVNAGVSGYGPIEENLLLRRVVPRFKPRAVVMAFFEGNDLRNAAEFPQKYYLGPLGYLRRVDSDSFWGPHSYLLAFARIKGRTLAEKFSARRGLELSRSAILEARDYAQAQGAHFFLLLLPDVQSARVGRPYLLKVYDRIVGGVSDINAAVEAFARGAGIDVLNLSPEFDNAADENLLRFKFDGHFTREGHRLAGEALGKWIRSRLAASSAQARAR